MQPERPTPSHLETAWRSNPYRDDVALAHSSYAGMHGDELVRLLEAAPVGPFARTAHAAFREFVLDAKFPCLGARSALARGTYRFGAYRRLADPQATRGLARDLHAFAAEREGFLGDYTTFVAVFGGPRLLGKQAESDFERLLWCQLDMLHEVDREYAAWDPRVSHDPADPSFSFSIAGKAYFVVGMHPSSGRPGRRFAWPTLVFNAQQQFEALRRKGQFNGLRMRIRTRDMALAGSINPNLSDYGERSEAAQYSGRRVDETWTCPFRPR